MGLPPIFKFTHTGTGRHELAELVRYGKPLVLDMKEVDLFDQLPDLFEQIRPGLWKAQRPRVSCAVAHAGRAAVPTPSICAACIAKAIKPTAEAFAPCALARHDDASE